MNDALQSVKVADVISRLNSINRRLNSPMDLALLDAVDLLRRFHAGCAADGSELQARIELLERLIRGFVVSDRAVLGLPEDAYLDPKKLDTLTDALQKRTAAVTALYLADQARAGGGYG